MRLVNVGCTLAVSRRHELAQYRRTTFVTSYYCTGYGCDVALHNPIISVWSVYKYGTRCRSRPDATATFSLRQTEHVCLAFQYLGADTPQIASVESSINSGAGRCAAWAENKHLNGHFRAFWYITYHLMTTLSLSTRFQRQCSKSQGAGWRTTPE